MSDPMPEAQPASVKKLQIDRADGSRRVYYADYVDGTDPVVILHGARYPLPTSGVPVGVPPG